MRCSACDFNNPEGARFCAGCGSRLSVALCPHCSSPIAPLAHFCMACGEPIVAAEHGGTPEAMAERRRVSVLFVDLEQFTTIAETLDPEDVRLIQSRYFETARGVVAAYGGTIEKFIGDAVMAVWGAPTAHEDDAERAVRAALALVDGVSRIGTATSMRSLAARAAVTTGEAAVTVGATGQGMVAGDLVNTAARLQSRASPRQVIVDSATRELAADAVDFERSDEMTLKGRAAPVATYRAVARTNQRLDRPRGLHTGAFVGRDRELRELIDLYDAVARDRRSRLVSVTGVAGSGKSRLAWELSEYIESLPGLVAWHAGHALPYGDEITFSAIADMVRRRLRIPDGADDELARRQLHTALGEFVRDETERRWMEPRLALLFNHDERAEFGRDELFAAWRRFFQRVSDLMPTILVFEDLQWADPSLLDFIEHLVSWSRDSPLMIITLARPELLDRRATWGSGFGGVTTIHLNPLDDAVMHALLLGRAPGLTEPSTRRIIEHAGGVPLYAVEVARSLADHEVQPSGERRAAPRPSETSPEVAAMDVPDSLHGLIAARIDALPGPERQLLLTSAVLGRRFELEAITAVSESGAAAVREQVEGLVRREILSIHEEMGRPGRGQVGFVQELVREVAYGTLSRSRRRALHLAAARYLEAQPNDDRVEALAAHLVEAHRLAPEHADAPRVARRAVGALRRSAQNAQRLHVPERALGHLEHALRLTDSAEQRAVVLEEAAAAARAASRLTLAEEHLREAVELHHRSGHSSDTARTHAQLASVLLMAQQHERALAELRSALRANRNVTSSPAGVELAAQLARARILVGDDKGGLKWARKAIGAARRLGLTGVATDLLITMGTARFRLGDEAEGLDDLRRAIREAEETGALTTELRARNNLAWLVVGDDPRVTMDTAREAVELARAMGVGDIAAQLAEVACSVALDTGDWEWALETAAAIERQPASDANRINLAASVAMIHALQGRPGPMARLDAMAPFPEDTDPQVIAGVDHARAWVAFTDSAFAEAHRLAARAAGVSFGAERVQEWTLATRAALWLGDAAAASASLGQLRANAQSGRASEATVLTLTAGVQALEADDGAADRYRSAEEAWRQLDLPVHLALCMLDAQRVLPGSAEPAEAVALLDDLGAHGLQRLSRR